MRHSTTSPPCRRARSTRRASRRLRRCISLGTSRRETSTGEDRSRRRTICSDGQWTSRFLKSAVGSRCPPSTCPRKARTRRCANCIALIFIGHLRDTVLRRCLSIRHPLPLPRHSPYSPLALYTLFSSETDTFKTAIPLRARAYAATCGTSSRRSKAKRLVPCTDHPLIASARIVSSPSHCIVVPLSSGSWSHRRLCLSIFLLLIGVSVLSARGVVGSCRCYVYIQPSVVQCPSLIFACLVCNRSV